MNVTIAVLDDDVRILDAVEMVLDVEDWTVRTYTTGEAFLADLAADLTPKCLLLDPHLPGMSGADVVHTIASGSHHLRFPIIGITARPSSSVTAQIVEAGAVVVLTKPFSADELLLEIRSAVNRGCP